MPHSIFSQSHFPTNPFVPVAKAARAAARLAPLTSAYHPQQSLVCCQAFRPKPAFPGLSLASAGAVEQNSTELCSWRAAGSSVLYAESWTGLLGSVFLHPAPVFEQFKLERVRAVPLLARASGFLKKRHPGVKRVPKQLAGLL